MIEPGTLYVVATPIGNLDDMSKRAIDVLQSVAVIAAEDIRHSKKLLQYFHIKTRLVSYHDFSSESVANELLDQLMSGQSIALISDAGTPLISDPGYKLVNLLRDRDIPVIPIPGASAVIAALSVAGLATDRFVFEGFLPAKTAARLARLKSLSSESRSLVIYESPHRILASLTDMGQAFGESRQIFIGRELTKKFETHYRGTIPHCLQCLQQDSKQGKGECVLVVQGCSEEILQAVKQQQALDLVDYLRKDVSMKKAVSIASQITGARKNQLYEAALKVGAAAAPP